MNKLTFLWSLFLTGIILNTGMAQDIINGNKILEIQGVAVVNTRGINPYIKIPKPVSDSIVIPKSEKKKNSSISYCKITMDNWTENSMDIYVDGVYEGTIAAWSDGYVFAEHGVMIYGISADGTVEWGPYKADCFSDFRFTPKN